MTHGQTRNIKYQLCFHAHGMDREVASVFCNPETYCDCRKDALKQLVKTVQFYMGFLRGPGGSRSAQAQYWPAVDQIKHWKSLLAGFGKPPEWYATIWARAWCRPLRALVPGDSDAARLQQLSEYIRAFFNETPVDHFVQRVRGATTSASTGMACARIPSRPETRKRERSTFFLDVLEDRARYGMLRPWNPPGDFPDGAVAIKE